MSEVADDGNVNADMPNLNGKIEAKSPGYEKRQMGAHECERLKGTRRAVFRTASSAAIQNRSLRSLE